MEKVDRLVPEKRSRRGNWSAMVRGEEEGEREEEERGEEGMGRKGGEGKSLD